MFGHLIQGLSTALLLGNLFYLVLGVTGGIVIGALPGLTATMGVAILLPFTFGMDAVLEYTLELSMEDLYLLFS